MLDDTATGVLPSSSLSSSSGVLGGGSRPYDAEFDRMARPEASARQRSKAVRANVVNDDNIIDNRRSVSALEEEEEEDDDEDLEGCVDRAVADAADARARATSPHGDLSSARLQRLLCRFPVRADNRKRSSFVALDARRLPFDIRAPLARRLSDETNASYAREFDGSPPTPPYETVLLDVRGALLSTAYPDGYSTVGDAFEEVRVSAIACVYRRGRTNGLCLVVVADVQAPSSTGGSSSSSSGRGGSGSGEQPSRRVQLRAVRPFGELPEEHVVRPGLSLVPVSSSSPSSIA